MLDLTKIARQITRLREAIRESRARRDARLETALGLLEGAPAPDELTRLVKAASSTWQFAYPLEELRLCVSAEGAPGDYTAAAADASQVVPSRHDPLPYYLVNTGRIVIGYGESRSTSMESEPILGDFTAAEEEMSYLGYEVRRDAHIMEERLAAEFRTLAELAARAEAPAVTMYDGSLILWYLRKQPDHRRREIVNTLTSWFGVCREGGALPVGYISRPGARDVVYDVAMLACDQEPAHCDRCKDERSRGEIPCSEIVKLHDADVFGETLKPGERSAVFVNRSTPILKEYGGEHNWITYFYLNVGAEVARVEFPRWVFDDGLTGTVQSLVLDQCKKGGGYPRVLALAHEFALVEKPAADAFLGILETAAFPELASPKEMTKRRRRI